ncbi:MAG: phenylalanine--tRNA ligase subunit beta [Planctomycetaceae bacterium]|jgi:phenylalanyl-tRNA synthetase beta chain|nr:phenylalanine--tRNA ligase subunit beta [Planctomycetaceae bacterium]MBT6156344.1 phenylalanine--tRNA ligase subunit beta [Planctomycetaceae bacterium]MBT6483884.1 phenylalanine--tRNA ligase subunit beta [Planctomycetaceae bacterium]MBT6496091.1 phenylalanine--tRNA ligase subunit beta [Planctomycetaceae bacterium]
MIVSWNWLKEYVALDMSAEELTLRLTMSGLNLEGTEERPDDLAIDLEVTSNRPDCLGHIGVAREIAALYDLPLKQPDPQPPTTDETTASATSVEIECDDLCPRYFARVIRGVKTGPSPAWLRDRLETLGIASINNVVDVTNYVLMESGQPLHAFDFDKLHGNRIVVRRAKPGEKITAIDQRDYELDDQMCVIADADRPVAIGGVMGGLDTEIGNGTVNVLIETADFAPLSIRNTARKLNLHSDSSYRFERGVDPDGLDWGSRRCCQLILEIAGGELLDEPVIAGKPTDEETPAVTLRFAQLKRILGIDIPAADAIRILKELGLTQQGEATAESAAFIAPSWRRDLTREIDLIEEVVRIYGYDEIPADVPVPLMLSTKTRRDRVADAVRDTLTAAGFFEAITMSFVSDDLCDLFTPRGDIPRLKVEHSSRKHENVLRQSLIPSLLVSRRENERHGTPNAELFEIAHVYLKAEPGAGTAPLDEGAGTEVVGSQSGEPQMMGLVSGRSFADVKGVVRAVVKRMNGSANFDVRPSDVSQFAPGRGGEILLNGEVCGWLGELDREVSDKLDLRDAVTVAEFDVAALEAAAELTPTYTLLPQFPAMDRDLNFMLDETVAWSQLADAVRESAGPLLDTVSFGGQYRGKQIPAGKKSYIVRITYRSHDRTLTTEEVDMAVQGVVTACESKLGATQR